MSYNTIAERLRAKNEELTRSERQLTDIILKNYPVSGLGTITTIADAAKVSTPTVARLVQKLGFKGFPEFQAALRKELDEKISGPLRKHEIWAGNAPDGHIINRFTEAVISNIKQTLDDIDIQSFDSACHLLSDANRSVFIAGGRITRSLADNFFLHLQVTRARVIHIRSNSNAWPHDVLDIKEGDVVVIFDIRRYENSTLRLAEFAKERGAEIILFTDQWHSPITPFSTIYFSIRIIVPSAWDSLVTHVLLTEIILANVQERIWETTRRRMEDLEEIFDRTKLFRKF